MPERTVLPALATAHPINRDNRLGYLEFPFPDESFLVLAGDARQVCVKATGRGIRALLQILSPVR